MQSLAVAILLLLGTACQLPTRGAPLVVVLVVDQMRPDYLDRFASEFDGGLARLVEEGRIYENASYEYALTLTAPGHATIASGTWPSTHGYVGNSWYDHGIGRWVRCSEDENSRLLVASGTGHSPRRLLRTCIGDWLKTASPHSRVVAISDKARSAVALGGQRPDWAVWRSGDDYVSSDYYGDRAPEWLLDWNRQNDILGDGRGSPTDERALLSVAIAAVDALQLGFGGASDLLLLGCSVGDYVGHQFGPRSQELHDFYLRLDDELGQFFELLDARLGRDGYRVLLGSDHGVAEEPEDLAAAGIDARRITATEFNAQLDSLSAWIATRVGLQEDAFARGDASGVVYTEDLRGRIDDALRSELIEAFRGLPSVAEVYEPDASTGGDEYAPYFRSSFHPSRGYDLYFRHREHWLVGVGGSGTTHGSCYPYDRRVPLVLMGPGIEAGRVADAVQMIQVAPTLARWLGVPVPGDLPGQGLRP